MIGNLSNDYGCYFVGVVYYTICIHLGVSNITECFQTPDGNGKNIYINDKSLDVNGRVNKIENGTVVSIFCPGSICGDSMKDIMLFNIGIRRCLCLNTIIILNHHCPSVSVTCDEHADPVDGKCMCKGEYTGDGTLCEKLGKLYFQDVSLQKVFAFNSK